MDFRAGLLLATLFLVVAHVATEVDGGDNPEHKRSDTHFGLRPRSPWPFRPPADEAAEARKIRDSAARMKDAVADRLRLYQGVQGPSDIVLSGERPSDGSILTYTDRMSPEEEAWIVAAGKLRAANCVNLLLNRISDVGNVLLRSQVVVEYPDARPAFHWLCEIGAPAFMPSLNRIPKESDSLTRVYLVELLQTIKGKAETKSMLIELEKTCANDEQRQRIAAAIKQCDDGPYSRTLKAYSKGRLAEVKAPDQSVDLDE